MKNFKKEDFSKNLKFSRILNKSFYFLILVLILLLIPNTMAQTTKEPITGKVLAQQTNVSIFVMPTGLPILTIISPQNKTYANTSILLNYTASNAVTVWYNLDSTANITITSPTSFNTNLGSHTLYLYANNNQGTTSRNITFLVNSSYGWEINSTKYYGSTTNFTYWMDRGRDYMQNITNFSLEIPNYGKIVFNIPLNISRDMYLDEYSDIANNSIYINSNHLLELNQSATLWIYNLTLSNPRVVKDGVVCPSTICVKESYLGGTLKFNVSHFTAYSAEETPASGSSPSGGSSGGGGSGGSGSSVAAITKFSIDKEEIKVSLKQGETKKELLTITNTGNAKISISFSSPKLEEFIKISEESFDLNAGEIKVVTLDFIAKEDAAPDLNMGKMIVKADRIEEEILIAIEIISKKPLFDVKTEIPKKFLNVMPGEEILATIKLFNIMGEGKVDVRVEYIIKNEENKVIVFEEETIAVETQTSFIKEFKIPSDIKYGKYMLYIKTTYNGNVASASAWFSVTKKPFGIGTNAFLIIVIIILLILFYELRKIREYIKSHIKIDENMLIKKNIIKRR